MARPTGDLGTGDRSPRSLAAPTLYGHPAGGRHHGVRRQTGSPRADAVDAFDQARSRQVLASLSRWARRQPGDVDAILPFDEVVAALGRLGERQAGLRAIPLDAIVGTVDRGAGPFDRRFRPRSGESRDRWVRLDEAARRGEPFEPISVYQVGEAYFVRDGHHRVSVARAAGHDTIEADVTEVLTRVGASVDLRMGDLPLKTHERFFLERVPLPPAARHRVVLAEPHRYAELAEAVEAWGFRLSQERGEYVSREETAAAWFRDEYEPVTRMLREAGLLRSRHSETEAYMRVAHLRYLVLRTHEWDDAVIERVRQELESPSWNEDTMVRRLRKELK